MAALTLHSHGTGIQMKGPTRPLLRFFGGKWRLAPWIVAQFPRHTIYTECFGGGGAVLLRKPRSYAEVYNDLDEEIVNLFRVARYRGAELLRAVELTPYARSEFELSFEPAADDLERARRTLVRSYMGFGSTMTRLTRGGRLMRTGFREYTKKNRRSIPAHDWATIPSALPSLFERLKGVVIENREALEVLRKHDGPDTLHYVDPPYPHWTRGRNDGYRHELDEEQHCALLHCLVRLTGKVVVSSYNNALYAAALADWRTVQRPTFADGARARTETLWLNYSLSPSAVGSTVPDLGS